MSHKPRVLVITGPTAAGKSAVACALARRLDGEIVSADSVQVYRELNIGANKPSAAELQQVPHHLVNVLHVGEGEFSAGTFYERARQATADILSRGRVPIVVGGTMMYMRWYLRGKPAAPQPSLEVRAEVEQELEREGWDWERGLERLQRYDPARAAQLHRNDWYRLRRALEVCRTTGGVGVGALPVVGGAPRRKADDAITGDTSCTLDYDFRCFFLYVPRKELNRLVDERCEQMVLRGLLEETAQALRHLHDSVVASPDLPAGLLPTGLPVVARAIGYRQAAEYLQHGERTPAGLRAFLLKFMQATRHYARRQYQWHRADPLFRWVRANANSLVDALAEVYRSDGNEDAQQWSTETQTLLAEDAALRAQSVHDGRQMKTYIPQLRIFADDQRAAAALDRLRRLSVGERMADGVA